MISDKTFATIDQISGYYYNNLNNILAKTNLSNLTSLEASNYYIFEEDNECPYIVLVNLKTEYYVSITKLLIKKTGQDIFSKIPCPKKRNINSCILENKISSGSLCIKHIDSDRIIRFFIGPPFGRQAGPTRQHMMDYIRYQEINNQLFGQSPTTSLVQPSTLEEIDNNTDYKDNVTCRICLINKINIVCIPCGHCFCSGCNTNSINNLCALCRKPIINAQALFI